MTQELSARFGTVVRQLRDAEGWSQEELALRADLNRSYLGEIERGSAMPSLATVAKLAYALDVSLPGLLVRCEEFPPRPAVRASAG